MFHTNPYDEHIAELAQELQCTEACAKDVHLLRLKFPAGSELEQEVLREHKQGTPPNMRALGL